MIKISLTLVFYFISIISSSICLADTDSNVALVLTPAWENKYVTEGRDNLESGGLYSFEISTSWQHLNFGSWFAHGDSESYQEINFYIEYGFEIHSLESYLSFTRLIFPKENEEDNEVAIGINYSELVYITPAIDYTWSSNADGAFLELSLSSQLDFQQSQIVITPYILQAFDFGYVTASHNGPNNLQVGIRTRININSYVHFDLDFNHSWAQEDIQQENMGDITWFGMSLILNI